MSETKGARQAPFPNTFLIGIQKAGTTTLNDWLSQHPEIFCYNSLKDIPLFVKFPQPEQLNKRLLLETPAYNQQQVVLHSAVNYIFYPSLLQQIAEKKPDAKLILIVRDPVARAVSSYFYFRKMMREQRDFKTALIYQPKKDFEITRDNNDFTYIEHGFYYEQVKNCLQYFSKDQLLVLDYDDLKINPQALLKNVFHFLNIDETFQPDLSPKNVTGELKSKYLQQSIIKKSPLKKWIIDKIVDPIMPVNKRKMLKNKLFEINTSKQKQPVADIEISNAVMKKVRTQLREFYLHDAARLDELLGTKFYSRWFGHEVIPTN